MVELNFKSGDSVKLKLVNEDVEGRVLESPDNAIVLIKLKSGYNVGINKENILGSRILKKFKEEEVVESLKIKQNNTLPAIGLIITGGTIASKVSQSTGGVKPIANADEFLSFYPELLEIVRVKKIDIPFKIFSENMNSEHWQKIAESVKSMLDDSEIKGVIVSHGTDTLHYTSSALSFFLKNLNKPVVLTYSQRSIDRGSSDARLNLLCSARMALSECAEVILVGHASINDDFCYALRGTKVKKMHSSKRDAFKPVNSEIVAKVWKDKVEFVSKYRVKGKDNFELDNVFSDKVALIQVYPGQTPDILDFYALKYKGIVISGTGLGHVPEDWIPVLRKHIKNGLVVCMTSQCINGRVDPFVYSSGREILDAGVIYLGDMLAETALVKLGWVLGHYGWKAHVKDKMLENISGELSERLIE